MEVEETVEAVSFDSAQVAEAVVSSDSEVEFVEERTFTPLRTGGNIFDYFTKRPRIPPTNWLQIKTESATSPSTAVAKRSQVPSSSEKDRPSKRRLIVEEESEEEQEEESSGKLFGRLMDFADTM